MSITDPISDMLTRVRNSLMRRKLDVVIPFSGLKARILDILKSEGYIRDYSIVNVGNGKSDVKVLLKYYNDEPVIKKLKRVSKPGRRVYVSSKSIPVVANGLGISILSTSAGLMADHDARKNNVGGEVICQIF